MSASNIRSFGSWRSPITADIVARGALSFSELQVDGSDVYWLEGRPHENGRSVIVQRSADGKQMDAVPQGFNVRSAVHEYGGGSYAVRSGEIYFTNWDDQCIYRASANTLPKPVTAVADINRGYRYADFIISDDGWIFCVRERHRSNGEPVNEIVAISILDHGLVRVIASGNDFYSSPRANQDETKICWLSWDHPNMPWDSCTLWVADMTQDKLVLDASPIAGTTVESIVQPRWSPDGRLFFISDKSSWWNLAAWDGRTIEPFIEEKVDQAEAAWQFGYSSYVFLGDGSIIVGASLGGQPLLRHFSPSGRELAAIPCDHSSTRYIAAVDETIFYVGRSPTVLPEIVCINSRTYDQSILKKSSEFDICAEDFSLPKSIKFLTTENAYAYAYYYAPQNSSTRAPEYEKPPLIVMSHGGPTGATGPELDLKVQFWTSRGFAVVDVNYRGSSGYGRSYRESLKGMWGIYDTADCVAAAQYLIKEGLADETRLAIRGSSAGGYTTINALTFADIFTVGATYYGIADLNALLQDTHKFESRYLESLIGPYQDMKERYYERSAINYMERLSCPIIIFQGLDDKVVPPAQAIMMSDVLRKKGLPFAYVPFAKEQHGFRQPENIKRAMEAELFFYGCVMGFEPHDVIKPVKIENADNLDAS